MKKILQEIALCVVIGCTGSVMGAGAENTPGRYVAPSDAGGSAKASPTQAAMWTAPAPEEDSGLTWQQVMGIVMLCGGCCGGGVLWQKARQVKIEPQPLEVAMSKDYVTRSEFDEYRKQVALNFDRVHKRLDTVMPAVAEIKGEMHRLAVVQEKILGLLLNGKASE